MQHLETLFDDQNTAKLSSIIYRTSAFAAAQNGDSNDEDDDEGDNASSRTMQDKTMIAEAALKDGAVGAPPLDFNSRGGGGGSGSGRGDEEELEMEEVRSPGSAHSSIISGRRSRTGGGAVSVAEGEGGDDVAVEERSVVRGSDFESDEEEEEDSDFRPQENLWLAMPEGHLALPRISTLGEFLVLAGCAWASWTHLNAFLLISHLSQVFTGNGARHSARLHRLPSSMAGLAKSRCMLSILSSPCFLSSPLSAFIPGLPVQADRRPALRRA